MKTDRFGTNFNPSGRIRGSQVVRAGDFVMFAATPNRPLKADIGIEGQTQQVLDKIDQRLHIAGSTKNHIVSVQIMLADRVLLEGMNAVWDHWVSQSAPPIRFCHISCLASEQMLVEMAVTATRAPSSESKE